MLCLNIYYYSFWPGLESDESGRTARWSAAAADTTTTAAAATVPGASQWARAGDAGVFEKSPAVPVERGRVGMGLLCVGHVKKLSLCSRTYYSNFEEKVENAPICQGSILSLCCPTEISHSECVGSPGNSQ